MDDAELYRFLQEQLDGRYDRQRTELDHRFAEYQAEMDRRFAGSDKQLDHIEQLNQEQVDRRFSDLKEQIALAREAMEKRLDGMNEFRDQLRDQAARFISRDELNAISSHNDEGQARNAEAIQGLSSRMDLMQGRDSGSSNYRTERRLDLGQVIQIAVMLIMVASVIVVFAHGSG
jgi:hypothetical protein